MFIESIIHLLYILEKVYAEDLLLDMLNKTILFVCNLNILFMLLICISVSFFSLFHIS